MYCVGVFFGFHVCFVLFFCCCFALFLFLLFCFLFLSRLNLCLQHPCFAQLFDYKVHATGSFEIENYSVDPFFIRHFVVTSEE